MKNLIRLLKNNRERFIKESIINGRRKYFSPILYSQYIITIPLVKEYAYGNFIDIGCGDQAYKKFILNSVSSYESLDVERRANDVNYISNICNMKMEWD